MQKKRNALMDHYEGKVRKKEGGKERVYDGHLEIKPKQSLGRKVWRRRKVDRGNKVKQEIRNWE